MEEKILYCRRTKYERIGEQEDINDEICAFEGLFGLFQG
jgi:hypothetical protein